MATTIITPEDLQQFKVDLLNEFKTIIEKVNENLAKPVPEKAWIKSHQVQRLLGISPGTLQTLRINGTIPYSKVGGVLFYNKEDLTKLLENNMRNKETYV